MPTPPLSPVSGTAKQKPLKLTNVWDNEAGLTDFIAQQVQLDKDIEADPANQQAGLQRFTSGARKKKAAIGLAIQQATDQRSRLQGKPVSGLAGFSNRRR